MPKQTSVSPTAEQRQIAEQLGIDADRLARDIAGNAGASKIGLHVSLADKALTRTATYESPRAKPSRLPEATEMYAIAKQLQLDPAELTKSVLNSARPAKQGPYTSFSTRELRERCSMHESNSFDVDDLIQSLANAVAKLQDARQRDDALSLEAAVRVILAQGQKLFDVLRQRA